MSDILENPELHNKLSALGKALVNQELAQVAIPPRAIRWLLVWWRQRNIRY